MTEQLLDSKLKSLALVCKENGNYRKLTIAYFILIKNLKMFNLPDTL